MPCIKTDDIEFIPLKAILIIWGFFAFACLFVYVFLFLFVTFFIREEEYYGF